MQHIDETARALPPGHLQARMLHVSRLATIGEMAAGIAHELNQPLTAIANYAQACERLLARPSADLEECRQALREITTQAVRASDIMRRLQTLARSQEMDRTSTDLEIPRQTHHGSCSQRCTQPRGFLFVEARSRSAHGYGGLGADSTCHSEPGSQWHRGARIHEGTPRNGDSGGAGGRRRD